jgi:hypothetical protein
MAHQMKTRIIARRAHLSYLHDDFDSALHHCQQIMEREPAALVRDVVNVYISTLGSRGYARTTKHGRDSAQTCLAKLKEVVPSNGWTREEFADQLSPRDGYFQAKKSEAIDPLHSYDPTAVELWLLRLQDRHSLMRELAALSQE